MSRTVFFGKIPYDYTEEQVLEVARSVGSVKEVRLVFDKETAKSKGFAFVEYVDKGSAASAVRNLNNYQVGNQRLKVDFSPDEYGTLKQHNSPIQEIASYVDSMSQDEKDTLLAEFKAFSVNNNQLAVSLLENNPQLAYAIVQTLIRDQKIDPNRADQLLKNSPAQSKSENKRSSREKTPKAREQTPNQPNAPSPAPASAPTAPQAPVPQPPVDDEQRQMIMQVMSFTPEQIELLPSDQREAVLDLRGRVTRGEIAL